MFIKDDVVYANQKSDDIKIIDVRIVDKFSLIVVFPFGEERIFDATYLLKIPAYEKLNNVDFFNTVHVEHGALVWNNGEIDIAPEEVYKESYEYEKIVAQ